MSTQQEKDIEKIEEALGMIEDARYLINQVMSGTLQPFRFSSEYYAYGEFGLKQAVGEGNPNDGSIPKIIEFLRKEN